MRRSTITQVNVGPTSTSTEVASPSEKRVAIGFGGNNGNFGFSLLDKPFVGFTTGFLLTQGATILLLKIEDVGDIVRHAWHATSQSALAANIQVLEVMDD